LHTQFCSNGKQLINRQQKMQNTGMRPKSHETRFRSKQNPTNFLRKHFLRKPESKTLLLHPKYLIADSALTEQQTDKYVIPEIKISRRPKKKLRLPLMTAEQKKKTLHQKTGQASYSYP